MSDIERVSNEMGINTVIDDKPTFIPLTELHAVGSLLNTPEDFMRWATELIRPESVQKKKRIATILISCLSIVRCEVAHREKSDANANDLATYGLQGEADGPAHH